MDFIEENIDNKKEFPKLSTREEIDEAIKNLTPSTRVVYDYIVEYLLIHTYPPVIREICEEIGYKSTSSAFRQLESLEKTGLIIMGRERTRAIKVAGYKVVRI